MDKTVLNKGLNLVLVSAAIGLSSQHGFAADMLEARTDLNSLSSVSIFNYSRPGSAEEKQAALELNLHGRAGQPWHAASFLGDDEKRIQLGLDIGAKNQLSITSGQGLGYARTRQAFSNFNPYYLHGGSRIAYNYAGASWTHYFGNKQTATVGSMQITANQLEKRSAAFMGFQSDNLRANLIQVDRGDQTAGHALDLGFGWSNKALSYQGLQTEAGAYMQQAQFSFYGAENNQFKLSVSSRNNPLSENSQENSVMLSYSKSFGRSPLGFSATEEEKAEQARQKSFSSTVVLSATAVAAVAAMSSGSGGQDTAVRKNEQHAIAKSTLNKINPRSVRENREYGTWIYRTPDGRYSAAAIQQGGLANVTLPVSIVPPGNTITASLHTHGGEDARFRNETFSDADVNQNKSFGVDGYLGTPAGRFLWHDLAGTRFVQLGTVATK